MQPLDAQTMHVTFAADCQPNDTEAVRTAMLSALEEIGREGPPAEEIERFFTMAEQTLLHPGRIPSDLDSRAVNLLTGRHDTPLREWYERLRAVDPRDAGLALDEALKTAIILVPEREPIPDGFEPFPWRGHEPVAGRTYGWWPDHAAAASKTKEPYVCNRIVVGRDGLSDVRGPGRGATVTTRFDACVGVVLGRWHHDVPEP